MNDQHNIIEIIVEKQLRWLGHLQGCEVTEFQTSILEWNDEGMRKMGKPNNGCMDGWLDGVVGKNHISKDLAEGAED